MRIHLGITGLLLVLLLVLWLTTPSSPWTEGFDMVNTPPNDPTPYDHLKCRTLNTPFNDEGGGNAVYLDRHDVRCEANEVLGQFHLVRNGNGQYRYDYTCCKVTSPAFSEDSLPSAIKALPDQLTELRQTISRPLAPALQEAPVKLAALEGEVQRIQQQLQKSSGSISTHQSSPALISTSATAPLASSLSMGSAPVREDIIPQNGLSTTGTAALQLGNQSSFLRDIQQTIRNEIYADRSLEGFF